MKASKLLNKKTLVKNLVSLIFCLSSFSHYSLAEPEMARTSDPETATINNNFQCKDSYLTRFDEFTEACAKAGLSSREETCREQINLCDEFNDLDEEEQEEEKDNADFKHCTALSGQHKALERRVERLEKKRDRLEESVENASDRMDKLTQDYHDTTEEVNDLAQERLQAKEEFDNSMASISEQKVAALSKTQNKIEELQMNMEETQDAITGLHLAQRSMWTQNKIACRQQANAAAQAVTARAYAQKQSGQTFLSIHGMLARQGKSARDEATIEHNRVMRNCTSIKNPENTKDNTNFGDAFLQKRAEDKEAIRKLKREIRRLSRRKAVAKKFYADTLRSLSSRESKAIEQAIAKEQFLSNKAFQLRQKLSNIQLNLRNELFKKAAKENELRQVESELLAAEQKLAKAQLSGASDDKAEAFVAAITADRGMAKQREVNADCIDDAETAAEIEEQLDNIPPVSIDLGEDPNAPSPEPVGDVDIEDEEPADCRTATPGVGRCP